MTSVDDRERVARWLVARTSVTRGGDEAAPPRQHTPC